MACGAKCVTSRGGVVAGVAGKVEAATKGKVGHAERFGRAAPAFIATWRYGQSRAGCFASSPAG
jgi:hypothetical protein